MKFFWEQDAVFLRLVKYLGKNRTSISRIILNGPFSPMVRLAPVSPIVRATRTRRFEILTKKSVPLVRVSRSY